MSNFEAMMKAHQPAWIGFANVAIGVVGILAVVSCCGKKPAPGAPPAP
jgi:hypothetical protein